MSRDDDRTQGFTTPIPAVERTEVIHRTGTGKILPSDRITFMPDRQPDAPAVFRRDPNLLEHDAFATQLARHRRWLLALSVAVAALIPAAAVVYGAAIAIVQAVLRGEW